jgi:hypothetical protein
MMLFCAFFASLERRKELDGLSLTPETETDVKIVPTSTGRSLTSHQILVKIVRPEDESTY